MLRAKVFVVGFPGPCSTTPNGLPCIVRMMYQAEITSLQYRAYVAHRILKYQTIAMVTTVLLAIIGKT